VKARFVDRIVYVAARTAIGIASRVPERIGYGIAAALGRLYFRCSRRRQQCALRFLRVLLDGVAAGRHPVVVDVDGIGVGLTLCYDIRFPGLYTALADAGASVIAVAASWGAGPGKVDQWTLLARARALDSTCVIAAAGQAYPGDELAGASKAPTGIGHSLVCSALGEVLAAAGPDPQLLVCDVEIADVGTARETLAVLRNRRTIDG
jgi:predicted amidohydrolase